MKLKIENYKLKIPARRAGMTLFIAVVIMGILLFISFAAVNVAIKGTLFATSGRDSQFAFYAADAGIECAEYWDSKFDAFATSTPPTPYTISCANSTFDSGLGGSNDVPTNPPQPHRIGGGGDTYNTSIFYFDMNHGPNNMVYCSIVTIRKRYVGSVLETYIKSRGYNTCDASNPRRVERGIEVTY